MKGFKRKFGKSKKRHGSTHSKAPSWNAGFGGKKESFKARCNECGSPCTVPFKPNGRKPVLCSICFRTNAPSFKKKSFGDKPSFESRSSGPSMKREIDEINRKLDRILSMLDKGAGAHKPRPSVPSRAKAPYRASAPSRPTAPAKRFAAAPKPPTKLDDIEWFKD